MGEVSLGPKSWRQFDPSPDVPPLVRDVEGYVLSLEDIFVGYIEENGDGR